MPKACIIIFFLFYFILAHEQCVVFPICKKQREFVCVFLYVCVGVNEQQAMNVPVAVIEC